MARKKAVELKVVSPFLNVSEAAVYLKVAKGTIYQWIHRQESLKFPVRYMGKKKPVFFVDELRDWVLQRNTIA